MNIHEWKTLGNCYYFQEKYNYRVTFAVIPVCRFKDKSDFKACFKPKLRAYIYIYARNLGLKQALKSDLSLNRQTGITANVTR